MAGYANNITPEGVNRWERFFRDRSSEVLASGTPYVELAYGPHPRQRMDCFRSPAARADAPTLIAIHGGLWFFFDRWMMHFLVPAFTAAGIHMACPSYRLAPEQALSDIVADCQLVGFSTGDYQRWNPIAHVHPRIPPALLVTGQRESPWLHEMKSVYQHALHAAGVTAEDTDAPDECHFSVLSAIGQS